MDPQVGPRDAERNGRSMQLSGSNYGMPNLSLEEALAFHAELGLRAMELTVLPGYATALENLSIDGAARDAVQAARHRV